MVRSEFFISPNQSQSLAPAGYWPINMTPSFRERAPDELL